MDLLQKKLAALKSEGLYRTMRQVDGPQGPHAIVDGRDVLMLCSNNYLGLADHPALKEAAMRGVAEFGVSSGASRLVSGNMELHRLLEERIARFKGSESAIVFNSGYAANVGIISAIVGRGDLIFSDRLNHASIVDGSLLSRATLVRYPHNDMAALRNLLERHTTKGQRLIVTDGVFSMDGDMAPLQELAALKREFNALLVVDDAHGSGVLGICGRGTAELCGVMADVDIHMGTLGKALGSFGAYAAASKDFVDYLVNSARSFIFSTSMPPAVLAASLAALDVVESTEGAELRAALQRKTQLFGDRLAEAGLDTMGSETQILPVQVGPADLVMQFSRMLFEEGIFAQGIRPPTVPAGQSRLRCTVMATHADDDLIQAADKIATIARKLGIGGAK